MHPEASNLISCSQSGPSGGWSTGLGRLGFIQPGSAVASARRPPPSGHAMSSGTPRPPPPLNPAPRSPLTSSLCLVLAAAFLAAIDGPARLREAGRIDGAVVFHLLLVAAAADAKQEASLAHLSDRGDQLRGLHRVTLLNERHAGAEFDGSSRMGGRGQHHEWVHGVVVRFRQIAPSRERRLARPPASPVLR